VLVLGQNFTDLGHGSLGIASHQHDLAEPISALREVGRFGYYLLIDADSFIQTIY